MSMSSTATIPQSSTPILKNRSVNLTQDATTSPSSTTMSESSVSASFPQTEDLAVHAHASAGFLASRKIAIRSDPALLTCFDAADKQLYDLWAPKT